MTDNKIMTIEKAMFILRHGSSEGEHKYFEAVDVIEKEYNRQQAEIEKFTKRQKPTGASGYKIENGKVVFFTNMLGGCRHEYENLDEVAKTLNVLLQECYSKDEIAFALKCKTEDLKTAKSEAIKEFAKRLRIAMGKFSAKEYWEVSRCISNLVKEMTEVNENG